MGHSPRNITRIISNQSDQIYPSYCSYSPGNSPLYKANFNTNPSEGENSDKDMMEFDEKPKIETVRQSDVFPLRSYKKGPLMQLHMSGLTASVYDNRSVFKS